MSLYFTIPIIEGTLIVHWGHFIHLFRAFSFMYLTVRVCVSMGISLKSAGITGNLSLSKSRGLVKEHK